MSRYSAEDISWARSLLFVPADRPDRFEKAASSAADVMVLDLEDAVAPSDKVTAREHARQWLNSGRAAMVRINGAGTPWHADDVRMIAQTSSPVMVPKADQTDLFGHLPAETVVVPLIETAAGISAAAAVCTAPRVKRLALGHIDLAAQLGVEPTDREALLFARSALVIASAAAGLAPPIDGVTTLIADQRATTDDVSYARRLGMTGKLCIHPSQIAATHHAAAPTEAEIAWAQKVITSSDPDGGASAVDGHLVDRPVLLRANAILGAASRTHLG